MAVHGVSGMKKDETPVMLRGCHAVIHQTRNIEVEGGEFSFEQMELETLVRNPRGDA